ARDQSKTPDREIRQQTQNTSKRPANCTNAYLNKGVRLTSQFNQGVSEDSRRLVQTICFPLCTSEHFGIE
ncbi:hypothetical protein, partial [Paraeggerthella hongkongensis]|uniref:hypothetical protein n=1 Tax=Paraeggerthella hongkongensis TaxID=230658 RepID=UPI001B86F79C